MVERAANQVTSASPPIDPFSLDFAIAEIAARQGELDGTPRMAPRNAPPIAPSFVQPPYATCRATAELHAGYVAWQAQLFTDHDQDRRAAAPDQ